MCWLVVWWIGVGGSWGVWLFELIGCGYCLSGFDEVLVIGFVVVVFWCVVALKLSLDW